MAMRRINPVGVVDKTLLRVFLRMNKTKPQTHHQVKTRLFSSANVLKKDSQSGDGTQPSYTTASSTPASLPSTEKGLTSGYNATSSQNYSKSSSGQMKNAPLTPSSTLIKPVIEQQPGVGSGMSNLHQRSTDSKLGNPAILHQGGPADRAANANVHVVKTNLDQTSSSTQEDAPLLASRRVDPSTVRQVYYFDTLAFVKKLESKGFTREQAEGFAECLVEIINSTLDHQSRHMVTKPQQEIAVLQLMSEIVSVKKDMTLLQKSEFSSLKTETEKISIELSQVQGHMNDEIVKLKGQFSLDINLERGRAIEAHAENEKKLQQLHNKIETEIANLRTIYEVYRNDVFKYAGGTVIAVGGLMLGVIRLWH